MAQMDVVQWHETESEGFRRVPRDKSQKHCVLLHARAREHLSGRLGHVLSELFLVRLDVRVALPLGSQGRNGTAVAPLQFRGVEGSQQELGKSMLRFLDFAAILS